MLQSRAKILPNILWDFFVLNTAQTKKEAVLTLTNHVCMQGKPWRELVLNISLLKPLTKLTIFLSVIVQRHYIIIGIKKKYFLGVCAADISWFSLTDFSGNHSHTLYMHLIFYTMISRWGLSPKVSSLNKCIILMHTHKTLLGTLLSLCVLLQN